MGDLMTSNIVKALELCGDPERYACGECPYFHPNNNMECSNELMMDAAKAIHRLEEESRAKIPGSEKGKSIIADKIVMDCDTEHSMKVSLLSTNAGTALCAAAAALCTGSNNPLRSLDRAIQSGHESVLEHATFTFKIEGISRVTLAQLTRHRLASYTVESQRYINQSEAVYVVPPTIEDAGLRKVFTDAVDAVKAEYDELIRLGIPKEDARYILPQAVTTSLIMTMNGRELRHFFELRCCNKAQWEIREMADKMLGACKSCASEIFKGAGPGCVRGHCPEARPCGHPKAEMLPASK